MNFNIIAKPTFEKEVKRLAKHYASFKADYAALIEELEKNPQKGTDLGGGLRKIRMQITSITFTVIVSEQDTILNLLYIYDKSEKDAITPKEIEALLTKNGLK